MPSSKEEEIEVDIGNFYRQHFKLQLGAGEGDGSQDAVFTVFFLQGNDGRTSSTLPRHFRSVEQAMAFMREEMKSHAGKTGPAFHAALHCCFVTC